MSATRILCNGCRYPLAYCICHRSPIDDGIASGQTQPEGVKTYPAPEATSQERTSTVPLTSPVAAPPAGDAGTRDPVADGSYIMANDGEAAVAVRAFNGWPKDHPVAFRDIRRDTLFRAIRSAVDAVLAVRHCDCRSDIPNYPLFKDEIVRPMSDRGTNHLNNSTGESDGR